jgi:hypothetical protein
MEDYGKVGSARLKHNMRAAHKYTDACCGTANKEKSTPARSKALEKGKDMKNAMNWKSKDRKKAFGIVKKAHENGEL